MGACSANNENEEANEFAFNTNKLHNTQSIENMVHVFGEICGTEITKNNNEKIDYFFINRHPSQFSLPKGMVKN